MILASYSDLKVFRLIYNRLYVVMPITFELNNYYSNRVAIDRLNFQIKYGTSFIFSDLKQISLILLSMNF